MKKTGFLDSGKDEFNLVSSPWIPVRDLKGQVQLVGLEELFRTPADWADLDLRPHERVAVMRLLICIAQAAIGAPEDSDGWADFGADLSPRAMAYLDQWRDAFLLLGNGRRFLQRLPVKDGEPTLASKLIPWLATGNNPTSNDHAGGTLRAFNPAELALALLAFQNFYPLYGAGYKGRGPCVDGNMLHTLLRGDHLAAVIINNALDAKTIARSMGGMGRPIWEQWPNSPSDTSAVENTRKTYLGRLVPVHRTVWICDNRAEILVGNDGWEYPTFEEYQEPTATVIVTEKGERRLLFASPIKSVWRDLHALTVMKYSGENAASAPWILRSHQDPMSPKPLDLWTGALVTDGKAKILDVVESVFHLESRIFTDIGRGIYELGTAYALRRVGHLRDAVRLYAKAMKQEDAPTAAAERHYWHALDFASEVLLKVAVDPAMGIVSFGGLSQDPWTEHVRKAVRGAYRAVCSRETPRQILAFVEGEQALSPKPKTSKKAQFQRRRGKADANRPHP
ncbi:MAG: type I-E CRISPR-associated protein Cse1/CasA [Verrucomicrobiales bacterium]|nr:type I-E CRISPR-associated protein Cse1/CasA [Verrucomicrobiales bacterium]